MHKPTSPKSASEVLYPVLRPYDHRMIDVSGGHSIYVEQCGNPRGKPVIVLHGGPGGGCSPSMRRFFDPAVYRIILFDQRGCGRSRPHACVEHNTTWDLVSDIVEIKRLLGIEKWILFGGSWGATLALIYAQAHPDHVAAMVLRGVFLATQPELDWFYRGGAGQFWPEAWSRFIDPIPEDERHDLIEAYHKRLFGMDHSEQTFYSRAWCAWENALAVLEPGDYQDVVPSDYSRAFARLENHYFRNSVFLSDDTAILNNIDRLQGIPGMIVQGRYDMICPPTSAYKLAQKWEGAKLLMVPTAGHALSEPAISKSLVEFMDELRNFKY